MKNVTNLQMAQRQPNVALLIDSRRMEDPAKLFPLSPQPMDSGLHHGFRPEMNSPSNMFTVSTVDDEAVVKVLGFGLLFVCESHSDWHKLHTLLEIFPVRIEIFCWCKVHGFWCYELIFSDLVFSRS